MPRESLSELQLHLNQLNEAGSSCQLSCHVAVHVADDIMQVNLAQALLIFPVAREQDRGRDNHFQETVEGIEGWR